jgi:hypothetical protein
MDLAKQRSYEQALELAQAAFQESEPEERVIKAGASLEPAGKRERVVLPFLTETCFISLPECGFSSSSGKPVSLVTRVLLLHYLLRADGHRLTAEWASYKDLPGGLHYAHVIGRRVSEPILRRFGRRAGRFQEIGLSLNGRPAGVGDGSFILQALPRVPVQYVLWEGDDEFPPSIQILFDTSVVHYLPLEDIVVLAQLTTGRLVARSGLSPT